MAHEKIRLDELLLKRGLVDSIQLARSLILSGSVLIRDQQETRCGIRVSLDVPIRIREKIKTYVSRGSHKLLGALDSFPNISIRGKWAIDMGASTGGFTQVLLEKGAKSVIAIDVGYGQMASKIRQNPKVKVMDRFHIKNLSWQALNIPLEEDLSELVITMDLSFMSIRSVFPLIAKMKENKPNTKIEVLALVKPQFEIEDSSLLEKGILRDRKESVRVLRRVAQDAKKNSAKILGLANSQLAGADGNREFFMHALWQ